MNEELYNFLSSKQLVAASWNNTFRYGTGYVYLHCHDGSMIRLVNDMITLSDQYGEVGNIIGHDFAGELGSDVNQRLDFRNKADVGIFTANHPESNEVLTTGVALADASGKLAMTFISEQPALLVVYSAPFGLHQCGMEGNFFDYQLHRVR